MNIVFYLKHIFEKFLLRFFLEFLFLLDLPGYPPRVASGHPVLQSSAPYARTPGRFTSSGHLGNCSNIFYSRICWLSLISASKSVLNMGRLRRKRMHKNDKHLKKKYRTKRRTKDLDQIHVDLQPQNAAKLKSQEVDMDLPGAGQYYCIQCA